MIVLFRETMNEIRKHEELKRAYESDAPLQSVSNITGKINFFEV
jgi:hypothetical protein